MVAPTQFLRFFISLPIFRFHFHNFSSVIFFRLNFVTFWFIRFTVIVSALIFLSLLDISYLVANKWIKYSLFFFSISRIRERTHGLWIVVPKLCWYVRNHYTSYWLLIGFILIRFDASSYFYFYSSLQLEFTHTHTHCDRDRESEMDAMVRLTFVQISIAMMIVALPPFTRNDFVQYFRNDFDGVHLLVNRMKKKQTLFALCSKARKLIFGYSWVFGRSVGSFSLTLCQLSMVLIFFFFWLSFCFIFPSSLVLIT